jgi:hypothetical protein
LLQDYYDTCEEEEEGEEEELLFPSPKRLLDGVTKSREE